MDERLTSKEKLSYGCGDIGSNIMWNLISSFLLLFYTNVALIPAVAAGTLILVSRVFDALIDPLIGIVVDRTHTRFGKARPYLVLAPVPLGILLVLTFSTPFHTLRGKLVFSFLTLMLVGIAYSFINIPYAALMALMTRNPHQKMQLSSLRGVGSAIGNALVAALTIPIATAIGFNHNGFSIAAALYAVISLITFLVVYRNTKERFIDHSTASPMSLKETLWALAHNRTFLVTFLFSFLNLIKVGVLVGSIPYFALIVLKEPSMISVLLTVMSISSVGASAISPRLFQKLGIRKGNWLSLTTAFLCFAVLPLLQSNRWPFLLIYILASVALGTCNTAMWAMSTYAIDYQQWRFGTRNDGLVVSSISLSTKVGIATGVSLVAYMLGWAHYDPKHPSPMSAIAASYAFYGGTMLFSALMFLCIAFYNMDESHPEIVRELDNRSLADLDGPASLANVL